MNKIRAAEMMTARAEGVQLTIDMEFDIMII
jgi:hypothetical protein